MHLDFERAGIRPKCFDSIQAEHHFPIPRWSLVDTDVKSSGIDNGEMFRFESIGKLSIANDCMLMIVAEANDANAARTLWLRAVGIRADRLRLLCISVERLQAYKHK